MLIYHNESHLNIKLVTYIINLIRDINDEIPDNKETMVWYKIKGLIITIQS